MNVKSVEKQTAKASITVEITRAELEPMINKVYRKACSRDSVIIHSPGCNHSLFSLSALEDREYVIEIIYH